MKKPLGSKRSPAQSSGVALRSIGPRLPVIMLRMIFSLGS
jgi:hypothetical protein